MLNQRMLEGFALHKELIPDVTVGHHDDVVFVPMGTRLKRIIRLPRGWRLWLSTHDFRYGTYLELFEDGRILSCTSRVGEGDEYFWVKPADRKENTDGRQA